MSRKTSRERGQAFADAQLQALRSGAHDRLVAAAAPFATALDNLERRHEAGELRLDFYRASRADIINQRRAAVAAATRALQAELGNVQRRAAALAATDDVTVTSEDF